MKKLLCLIAGPKFCSGHDVKSCQSGVPCTTFSFSRS